MLLNPINEYGVIAVFKTRRPKRSNWVIVLQMAKKIYWWEQFFAREFLIMIQVKKNALDTLAKRDIYFMK